MLQHYKRYRQDIITVCQCASCFVLASHIAQLPIQEFQKTGVACDLR